MLITVQLNSSFIYSYFHRMKVLSALICALLLGSCATTLPVTDNTSTEQKIEVGPGPEDLVLDTLAAPQPRLIVACSQRRKGEPEHGELWMVDLESYSTAIIPRKGEPDSLDFHPHGIDLVTGKHGDVLLMVVNHAQTGPKEQRNSIITYKVFKDHVEFVRQVTHPFIVSPNDVAGLPDGSFYLTNDSWKKTGIGLAFEKLSKRRSSRIVYCGPYGNCKVVAKRLAYANGIQATEEEVLVSTTFKKELAVFEQKPDNSLTLQHKIDAEQGLDNITHVDTQRVLIASHPAFLDFIRHLKDPDKHSPGIVSLYNLQTGEYTTVYANDGSAISANSVALYYHGKLFIGQVFDGFIQVVSIPQLPE